jgi:hypothetical protein
MAIAEIHCIAIKITLVVNPDTVFWRVDTHIVEMWVIALDAKETTHVVNIITV